ncbi:alpha/beta fold hydrolase [Streptomyces sp. NPDC004393]
MSPHMRNTPGEIEHVLSPVDDAKGLVVFVHGYLDDSTVWAELFECLDCPDWEFAAVDLHVTDVERPEPGAVLEGYRDQVLQVVRERKHGSARPLVIVGHSMGGQIAELAALREHGLSGLVLITPAPLGGYPMPAEQMEVFRQRARDKDRVAISRGKVALSFNIGVRGLKTLVNATASTPVETSLQQLEAWTVGHPLGAHPSQVKAPTLVVTSDDTFFTTEFLTGHVAPRFTDAGIARVPEAGHWPQVEQPARLAEVLTEFLAHIS